ncbi:MAG: glycosyltransferase family 2 protein [Pseudomonas sp.]
MVHDRISVVITCYNYARYLAESIQSVLDQGFPDLELIVVNDGSTDSSLSIMRGMAEHHGFTIIDQPNSGVSAATQAGFERISGEYFVFFDADDVMLPGRLATQLRYLKAHPDAGCCSANFSYIDADGQSMPGAVVKRAGVFGFSELFRSKAWMGTPTSMYRTQAVRDAGGFDLSLPIQDQPLELQVAHAGYSMHIIEDVVTLYRQHGDNKSHGYRKNFPVYLSSLERYRAHPEFMRARRSLINSTLKRAVFEDKPFAKELFRQLPLRQWNKKTFRRLRHYWFG